MVDAYRPVLDSPEDQTIFLLNALGLLFIDTCHPAEAEKLFKTVSSKSQDDPDVFHVSLGNQALILQDRGDLDGAMKLHKEEERICREVGNVNGLQRSLGNQALILSQQKRHREALSAAEEGYRLALGHGYTALTKQILPVLERVGEEIERSQEDTEEIPCGGNGLRVNAFTYKKHS
jgi:hypothetical protein